MTRIAPLGSEWPCSEGWLAVQFCILGRSAKEIAAELGCDPRAILFMLAILRVPHPEIPRETGVPQKLLAALALGDAL